MVSTGRLGPERSSACDTRLATEAKEVAGRRDAIAEAVRLAGADDVVLLCEFGVLHGHDGIRGSAHRLRRQYPGMNYEYLAREVEAEYAFLKWRATAPDGRTTLGADSFVVRNGKIIMQTVYYQDGKPNKHEKPTR